jgi:uncharacterized Zn-finger protein
MQRSRINHRHSTAGRSDLPIDMPMSMPGSHHCTDCSKVFTSRRNLRRHQRCQHEGIRVICPHCGENCGRRDNLRVHLRRRHQQERGSTSGNASQDDQRQSGSSHPTWNEVQLQPGTLIPWIDGPQLVVLTPTTIAGYQVPNWWTAAQERNVVGLTPARLATLEQFTTQVLRGQHTQTSEARRYTEKSSPSDPVFVISSDDEY